MSKNELAGTERWWTHLRRLIIPACIWQFAWLRHIPRYYRSVVWKDCTRSGPGVVWDMLYIFFHLATVPEHYGPSRFWEVPKAEWVQYYGCPYAPAQRARIAQLAYPTEYEIIYNDKIVGDKLAHSLSVRQPLTVATLNPDSPIRDKLPALLDAHDGRLILKPVYGRSGLGIMIAEKSDTGVVIHKPTGDVPLEQFTLDYPAFLQEVIRQDARMAVVGGSAVNTVRVVTLRTPGNDVLVIGCCFRTGVAESFVDNWSAGGVAVGVEIDTGKLRKFGYDATGNRYTQHPTSGFTFEGFVVPEWERILDAARTVQRELPFSKVCGVDICLNHDATPILIEINGLPDFVFVEQLNGPLLKDPRTLKVFADYGMLTRAQRHLLEQLPHVAPATV